MGCIKLIVLGAVMGAGVVGFDRVLVVATDPTSRMPEVSAPAPLVGAFAPAPPTTMVGTLDDAHGLFRRVGGRRVALQEMPMDPAKSLVLAQRLDVPQYGLIEYRCSVPSPRGLTKEQLSALLRGAVESAEVARGL